MAEHSCNCRSCEHTHDHHHGDEHTKIYDKKFWFKFTRIVIALIIMILGKFLFNEENYGVWVNFGIMFSAWIIAGYDVIWEALVDLVKEHKVFGECTLMIIATSGCFLIRLFSSGENHFFDAGMVMVLFQIGETIEHIATMKSKKAISDAVGLRAPFAHLVVDGDVKEVKPEDLKINDLIMVKAGEILPADGVVQEGNGNIDVASLTGESIPVFRQKGEMVNSGTILKDGSITIKVLKTYEDSTVYKIIKAVNDGNESKSKVDKFVDRFAKIYTPIVVLLAAIIAIVPPLAINMNDPDVWNKYLYACFDFLVIGCPCALVISIPLAYSAAIGLGSKNGLIIKGAGVIDKLNGLDDFATDKTGCLTYGKFAITKIHSDELDEKVFLEYLQAAESRSNHPLALAIIDAADMSSIATNVGSYKEYPGKGVGCVYKEHTLLAGSKYLLWDNQIEFDETKDLGSIVYLSVDGEYAGYCVLADQIRPESLDLISELRNRNINTTLLTGDKYCNALAVAETVGVTDIRADLLPSDKTNCIKEMMDKSHKNKKYIAYMGDGINDAPALAAADVGVAMGGIGSDLAIETSDVVIMNDDPRKFITSLNIAKTAKRRVYFNTLAILAVKVGVMIAAVVLTIFDKELPVIIAVLADTGLTAVMVICSLLLLYKKIK